jgi:hypothetical protein
LFENISGLKHINLVKKHLKMLLPPRLVDLDIVLKKTKKKNLNSFELSRTSTWDQLKTKLYFLRPKDWPLKEINQALLSINP